MKKKMAVLLLVLVTILSFGDVNVEAQQLNLKEAENLKSLGLFMGTDKGFELDKVATRAESAAMLVRLLGAEKAAKENKHTHPFTDVPKWANEYVGYMYKHGLTSGISKDKFGSLEIIDGKSYGTFILRTLGYDDSTGDFTWENSLEFIKDLYILDNSQLKLIKEQGFTRNELVLLSYNSLHAKLKSMDKTLMEELISKGAINPSTAADNTDSLENAFIEGYMKKIEIIPQEAITQEVIKSKDRDELLSYAKINRDLLPSSMKNFTDITTSGSSDIQDVKRNLESTLKHIWDKYDGIFPTHNEDIEGDRVRMKYDYILISLLSDDGELLGYGGIHNELSAKQKIDQKELDGFIEEYMKTIERIPEEAITIERAKNMEGNGNGLVPYAKINRELLPISMREFTDISIGGSHIKDDMENLKFNLKFVWDNYKGIFPTHNENIKDDMIELRYDYVFIKLLSKDGKLLGYIGIDMDGRK